MIYLHGIGHYHPENEITNQFLEELDIGTSHDWIMERVGIESRRTALPLDYIRETRNSDVRAASEAAEISLAETGRLAGLMALERAGVDASRIGLLLSGSSASDTQTPVEAARIARELGIEAPVIDVNSACTSFFAGMHLLSMMHTKSMPEYVMLVQPEAVSRTVNFNDRNSAVLWGDATTAVVLSTKVPSRIRISGCELVSDPQGADNIVVPRAGYFSQNGSAVQKFAIKKTLGQIQRLSKQARPDKPLQFVGHQANLRMLENVCKLAGVQGEHHHRNVDKFGNTAGSSSNAVISMRWDEWRPGDQVAVTGVGAGLSWGGYLLSFH